MSNGRDFDRARTASLQFDRRRCSSPADSDAARARARANRWSLGRADWPKRWRSGGGCGERIERQGRLSAVWIELDEEFGGSVDQLLDQVNRDVGDGRYAAVVSAPTELIDPLTAKLGRRRRASYRR